jgi:hypothetical protein
MSKGIVHPYYLSALGPGAAAMVGLGAGAFADVASRRDRCAALLGVLLICAVAATVAAQLTLLQRAHYLHWFGPLLIAGALVGVCTVAVRRFALPAIALTVGVLLIAPSVYSATTWLAPVEPTFPAAGPRQAAGWGGVGLAPVHLGIDRALFHYLTARPHGTRWALLTDAADTAAPFMLLGLNAGSLAGYSGVDPALDGPGLARLVARGQARYVLLGGVFSTRGGNRATAAVLEACTQLPARAWENASPSRAPYGLVLFDCAGREAELTAS